jgi:hypothetical protein
MRNDRCAVHGLQAYPHKRLPSAMNSLILEDPSFTEAMLRFRSFRRHFLLCESDADTHWQYYFGKRFPLTKAMKEGNKSIFEK